MRLFDEKIEMVCSCGYRDDVSTLPAWDAFNAHMADHYRQRHHWHTRHVEIDGAPTDRKPGER